MIFIIGIILLIIGIMALPICVGLTHCDKEWGTGLLLVIWSICFPLAFILLLVYGAQNGIPVGFPGLIQFSIGRR